jgi:hypothetical protein
MKKTTKPKPDDEAQSKRFIASARDAEADETARGAERAFQKVVAQKPKTRPRTR